MLLSAIAVAMSAIAFEVLEGVRSRLEQKGAIAFEGNVGAIAGWARKVSDRFCFFGRSAIAVGKKEINCFADAVRSRLSRGECDRSCKKSKVRSPLEGIRSGWRRECDRG